MNTFFRFKEFSVSQEHCAMKVTTDSCLFGAWVSARIPDGGRILDIGAGTGLLSLMLAQQHESYIDAVEIDENCFSQLEENFRLSPWGKRLRAIHADVRDLAPSFRYDLILSNPPFHEHQLASPDPAVNTARHSSGLTLSELLQTVERLLGENGFFAILVPHYRKQELLDAAVRFSLHPHQVLDVRHGPAHAWQRTTMILSRLQVPVQTDQMEIRDTQGLYSPAFSQLLAPYYLGL
jgi:tRNA1Val (adenine37-N6)-methyltransferase